MRILGALIPALLFSSLSFSGMALAQPLHGISMHGEPALAADYKNFPYVNPTAKKGGHISYGVVGTYDNLNPFILRGMRTTARGVWDPEYGNLIYETLMQRSRDEPFTLYGLLAQTVEWDDNRSFIQFNLNPKAKWSDGQPVTPEDVIFSVQVLHDKGRTPFAAYMDRVEKLEKVGENSVRFTFNDKADREFPLILASNMPILPKHAMNAETFDQTTLSVPIGSGPYRIKSIRPGENIVFARNTDYWGKDIPSKIGTDNYDTISVEYFLQDTTLFEAFKKGVIDVYPDGSPTHWERAYDFPAATSGEVVKDAFSSNLPTGMTGFVFNTRRQVFSNVKVRAGLSLVFDFEWANRSLFENSYKRTQCFWQNSPLSGCADPAGEQELAILGAAKDRVEPSVLDGTYKLPVTDGSGADRTVLKQAVELLKEGGYLIKGGKMINAAGQPLAFEFMTQNPDQEKLALAYQRSLRAIGVDMAIRTVDDAQYQARSGNFDYDMILKGYSASLSPGIEQLIRWSSSARDTQGSLNFAGVADPDIDRLMDAMLNARELDEFQATVRAFDRLLISGHYLIPLYHVGEQWVARRKHIERPQMTPLSGYQRAVWWDARAQK
jgi:peptide/nickel transport system substrate-binding protein